MRKPKFLKFPRIKKDRVVRFFVLLIRLTRWCKKKTGISLKECWHDAKAVHRHETCFYPPGSLEDAIYQDWLAQRGMPRREKFSGLDKVKKATLTPTRGRYKKAKKKLFR
jgi:hypothetical protein